MGKKYSVLLLILIVLVLLLEAYVISGTRVHTLSKEGLEQRVR